MVNSAETGLKVDPMHEDGVSQGRIYSERLISWIGNILT